MQHYVQYIFTDGQYCTQQLEVEVNTAREGGGVLVTSGSLKYYKITFDSDCKILLRDS